MKYRAEETAHVPTIDNILLTKLEEGDLIYNTDFRQVYASVLEDWMGADSRVILGKQYKKSNVLRS